MKMIGKGFSTNSILHTLFVSIVFISLLSSCKSGAKSNATPEPAPLSLEEQITQWTDAALGSGIKKDTVVLDFKFGMSKGDVRKHTLRLHSQRKMYKVKKSANVWEYVYDLRLDEIGKVRTYFDAFYQDNKLYKIECLPRIPSSSTPEDILDGTRELFALKYGAPHFELPRDTVSQAGPSYLWITGNRRIELAQSDELVVINYIDLVGEKLARQSMDI